MRKIIIIAHLSFIFAVIPTIEAIAKTTYFYRHIAGGGYGGSDQPPVGELSLRIDGKHPFTVGEAWSITPTLIGGDAAKFSFSMPIKPAWLSINAKTGEVSGIPSSVGQHGDAVIVATDGVKTAEVRLAVDVGSPIEVQKVADIMQFPDGTIERKIEVSGGDGDYSFKWDENHPTKSPEWLHLASKTGVLSGIAEEGEWDLSVEVSDQAGRKDTVPVKIDVVKGTNWFTHINGGMEARQISIGPNGGVFISGTAQGKAFMGRLDDEGTLEWLRTIQGTSSGAGYGMVATNGSIYMSGTTNDGGNGQNILVSKFSQYGNREWIRAVGGSGSQEGSSIAVGGDGSVVVAGSGFSISKLSSGGSLLWAKNFEWRGSEASAVAVDGSGNIYVAGVSWVVGYGSGDVVLAKLDPNGNAIWVRSFGGPENEYVRGLTIGSDGGIYVAGVTGNSPKFMVAKYSSAGVPQWFRRIGSGTSQDIAHDIVTTSDGSIYLAGESSVGMYGDHEAVFVQMNNGGNIVRARSFGNNRTDRAYGIAANSRGSVYLSGISQTPGDASSRALISRFSGPIPKTEGPLPADVLYKDVAYQNDVINFSADEQNWQTYDLPWTSTSIDGLPIGDGSGLTFKSYSFE